MASTDDRTPLLRPGWGGTAALVAAVALLGGCASPADEKSASRAAAPTQSSPAEPSTVVLEQNFPDPDVLRVGDTYFAYATQSIDGGYNVQSATSQDLQTWTPAATDPLPTLPAWAMSGRTWAPDVTQVGETFVMYFTARSIDPDLQCIGVARASDPAGPFEPLGDEPLVCPAARGGAIDAASFVDEDGRRYLLWKNDGNCCGKDTWLHIQPTSSDGLRLTGPPVRLVKQTEPWEGQLVEAPTLIRRDESYVLLYSANDYGGDQYTTGYAVSDELLGPYQKADEPLLTTEETGVRGPGGQDVVTLPDGGTGIIFHGWDPAYIARHMHLLPLEWRGTEPLVAP